MTPERPEGLRVAIKVIEVFESLGIEYHLGGSYASSIHGVPRQTQDVDLVASLRARDVAPLVASLGADFYVESEAAHQAIERRSSFNMLHFASGVKVDIFCLGDSAFDRVEFERAELTRFFGGEPNASIRVKSAEDTILRKLQWYQLGGEVSDRQWADVAGCLTVQRGNLDLDYLRHWAEEIGVADLLVSALREAFE